HTSTPSAEQILAAATRILQQPIYRQRAALVREDYARHDALTAIANEVAAITA
ncbi:TPA: glycosyltransferase, partial [Serratia marcescens]|nr:glycosyltransferase [Serratia marcescens]